MLISPKGKAVDQHLIKALLTRALSIKKSPPYKIKLLVHDSPLFHPNCILIPECFNSLPTFLIITNPYLMPSGMMIDVPAE